MKPFDFAACEDQSTNGDRIARSTFQPVAKMDRTQFVLVGPLDVIVTIATRVI